MSASLSVTRSRSERATLRPFFDGGVAFEELDGAAIGGGGDEVEREADLLVDRRMIPIRQMELENAGIVE